MSNTLQSKIYISLLIVLAVLFIAIIKIDSAYPMGAGSRIDLISGKAPTIAPILVAMQPTKIEARMYGMTGLFGRALGFSTGVDTALHIVAKRHPTVKVYPRMHWQKRAVLATAIANYKLWQQPIILSGHSLGGNAAMWIAHQLNAQGIPVAAIFSYDQTRYAACVPPNVIAAIGWYASRPGLGGGIVRRCQGNNKTAVENHMIRGDHVYVDDAPEVHAKTAKHVGDIIHMLQEMKGQ